MAANVQINITGENKAGKAFKEAADGAKGLEKNFEGLRDGADNSERRIIGFRDSLTGTQDVMKGLKDGDLVALTTGFADMASSVANLGADLLEWGKKALEGAKNVVEAHGAAVIAKAKDIASAAAHKAASVASTIATQAQAAAQWALNTAMEANPILLIVIALVALAAGIIYAYKHSETFRDIVDKLGDALQWVYENVLKPVGAWFMDTFVPFITQQVIPAIVSIGKKFKDIGSDLAGFLVDVWHYVGEAKDFILDLPDKIRDGFMSLGETILSPFKWAFNQIAKAWNNTAGKLSFKVPGWVPGIGDKGWSMPLIPELAEGGLVKARSGGTIVKLAEAGVDECVVPANKMQRMQTGAGITVVVQGNVYGVDQMDRLIADAIRRNARRGVA